MERTCVYIAKYYFIGESCMERQDSPCFGTAFDDVQFLRTENWFEVTIDTDTTVDVLGAQNIYNSNRFREKPKHSNGSTVAWILRRVRE